MRSRRSARVSAAPRIFATAMRRLVWYSVSINPDPIRLFKASPRKNPYGDVRRSTFSRRANSSKTGCQAAQAANGSLQVHGSAMASCLGINETSPRLAARGCMPRTRLNSVEPPCGEDTM